MEIDTIEYNYNVFTGSILDIQMLFNFTLSFPEPSCILGFSAPLPKLNFAVVSL